MASRQERTGFRPDRHCLKQTMLCAVHRAAGSDSCGEETFQLGRPGTRRLIGRLPSRGAHQVARKQQVFAARRPRRPKLARAVSHGQEIEGSTPGSQQRLLADWCDRGRGAQEG